MASLTRFLAEREGVPGADLPPDPARPKAQLLRQPAGRPPALGTPNTSAEIQNLKVL